MDLLRALLGVFFPPIVCAATLVAVAVAAWRARRQGVGRTTMSAWSLLSAVSAIGTQSFGFLLAPIHGALAAGLFVVVVLLIRRAAAGGLGVAVSGVATTTLLGFVSAWLIYAQTPPDIICVAIFGGMLVPCALTVLVALGALFVFVAAAHRERDSGESVRLRTYVGATSACVFWYLLGALVHWGRTGMAMNVTAG